MKENKPQDVAIQEQEKPQGFQRRNSETRSNKNADGNHAAAAFDKSSQWQKNTLHSAAKKLGIQNFLRIAERKIFVQNQMKGIFEDNQFNIFDYPEDKNFLTANPISIIPLESGQLLHSEEMYSSFEAPAAPANEVSTLLLSGFHHDEG